MLYDYLYMFASSVDLVRNIQLVIGQHVLLPR